MGRLHPLIGKFVNPVRCLASFRDVVHLLSANLDLDGYQILVVHHQVYGLVAGFLGLRNVVVVLLGHALEQILNGLLYVVDSLDGVRPIK